MYNNNFQITLNLIAIGLEIWCVFVSFRAEPRKCKLKMLLKPLTFSTPLEMNRHTLLRLSTEFGTKFTIIN
jgi:hypothetical protein